MTDTALDRLSVAVDALDRALDADDFAALESALASVPPAVDALMAPGAFARTPANLALARTLGEKLDSARVRVAILGDLGRRRMDMLGLAGAPTNLTYGR